MTARRSGFRSAVFVLVLANSALAANAQTRPDNPPSPFEQHFFRTGSTNGAAEDSSASNKFALRREAIKLKHADGGQLTDAHRTYLQRKLDKINRN